MGNVAPSETPKFTAAVIGLSTTDHRQPEDDEEDLRIKIY